MKTVVQRARPVHVAPAPAPSLGVSQPAGTFHRAVVGVCAQCGYANFAGCSVHNQLLSRPEARGQHYACGVRGCTVSTDTRLYNCSRCPAGGDLRWLQVLLLPAEVAYAHACFGRHPEARRTRMLPHALIVCALCLTAGFPGSNDTLLEYDPSGTLRDGAGRARSVGSWAFVHVHVDGCEGVGNEFALGLHPLLLTEDEVVYLYENLLSTPRGSWEDVASASAPAPAPARASAPSTAAARAAAAANAATAAAAAASAADDGDFDAHIAAAITSLNDILHISHTLPLPSGARPGPPPPHSSTRGTKPATTQARSDAALQGECTVCLDEGELYVLYPCGHAIACHGCAPGLRAKPCPLCRKPVQDTIRVFR